MVESSVKVSSKSKMIARMFCGAVIEDSAENDGGKLRGGTSDHPTNWSAIGTIDFVIGVVLRGGEQRAQLI